MFVCEKCGREYLNRHRYAGHMSAHARSETPSPIPGMSMQQYVGHKGIQAFADKYAGGDVPLAKHMLWNIGYHASDPTPWNNASKRGREYWDYVKSRQIALQDADSPSEALSVVLRRAGYHYA